jgi:UDP-perosamine 4-acetyltransferase
VTLEKKYIMDKLIIIGGGGHSRVLADILEEMGSCDIIGFTDVTSREVPGVVYIGDDRGVEKYTTDKIQLVNGIGSVRRPQHRQEVYEKFKSLGYRFFSVIHPRADLSSRIRLGEGVQIMRGVVINPGTTIEEDVIINTSASVDHDCIIGAHSHIAPGVVLCGDVKIGRGCHVGTGVKIIQGITIGDNVLIGAGEVVKQDVLSGTTLVSGVHDPRTVQ